MRGESKNIPKRDTYEDNSPFLTGLVVFIVNSIIVYAVLAYTSSGVPNNSEWKKCTFELLPAVLTFLINSWIAYYVYTQVKVDETQDKPVIDNVINFYKNPKHLLAVGLIIAIAAYVSISCTNKQHVNPLSSSQNLTFSKVSPPYVLQGGTVNKGFSLNDVSDGPFLYK